MDNDGERVVVGVDGSTSSRAAFRWALRYAEKMGARITAVTAWAHTPLYGIGALTYEEPGIEEAAEAALSQVVSESVNERRSQVPVEKKVQRGVAPEVLVNEANTADLLVLGSRGHGGVTGALLGSVSQHCVHHSPCPIVIVRHS